MLYENYVAFLKRLFIFFQNTRENYEWKGAWLNLDYFKFKITEFYWIFKA